MCVRSAYCLPVLIVGVSFAFPVSLSWAQQCGDLDNSGSVVTTDALLLLQSAVGQPVVLMCPVDACGNGVVDAGEDCDQNDLNGATCAGQGLFGDGLACGKGCVFDTSGCSATRYEDTGLGSVIDHQTGLEWQKTDNAGGLTDWDNLYSWTAGSAEPSGTAFTVFLSGLNDCVSISGATVTGGYAGHCDWRIPLIEELTTIVDCRFVNPCIDQLAFGLTLSSAYWSSTTLAGSPDAAWNVHFGGGDFLVDDKTFNFRVRAVRGGL